MKPFSPTSKETTMKQLAVIYHSAHGHTRHIAQQVAEGARAVPGVEVHVLQAEGLPPDTLPGFDAFVLG